MKPPAAKELASPQPLVRAFISYSRKDLATAEHIRDQLIDRCFEAFLDRHDILPGEPWEDRISKLIEGADSVVFLLSPDSIASEICDWEINEAERCGKRVLPVVIQDVDSARTPRRLSRLNYIFMRTPDEIVAGLEQLAGALLTDIEWVREQTRLVARANRWAASKEAEDHLLRGADLEASEAWAASRPTEAPMPSTVTLRLISESRAWATKTTRQIVWRNRAIAISSLVAALVMAVLGWSFYSAWQDSMINQSRLLAGRSSSAASDGDLFTAQLLALEALPDKNAPWFSQDRWRPYIEEDWGLSTRGMLMRLALRGHQETVRRAIYAPDGTRILTASGDGTAVLWDADGNSLNVLAGHTGAIWDAAFRHDGRLIATASADSTLRLWDAEGEPLATLATAPHLGMDVDNKDELPGLDKVAISPDGQRIAASGSSSTAFLWDGDGQFVARLSGHKKALQDVLFSPDGKQILTAGNDGTARLWNAGDGSLLAALTGHQGIVWSARFDPLGPRVLTVSADKTARLWDFDGTELKALEMHTDNIWAGAFTPDGSHIVTVSADESAWLWDAGGQPLRKLDGYEDDSPSVITFSSDGTRMVISAPFGGAVMYTSQGDFLGNAGTLGQAVGKGSVLSPDGGRILGPYREGAVELEYVPDAQTYVERVKETVPVCLPPEKRRAFFLRPEPPAWCLDLGKQPYGNARPIASWQEPLMELVLTVE